MKEVEGGKESGHSEGSPQGNEFHLPESDIRAMVRLMGEVAALNGSHTEKRKFLMEGLTSLIGANVWIWSMMGKFEPQPLGGQPHTVFLTGGLDERQLALYLKTQEHPDMGQLTKSFLLEFQERGIHLTRNQHQLATEEFYQSTEVARINDEAGLGPVLLSLRPTRSGQVSNIILFRKTGSPHFAQRETRIAHIILSEVAWIHDETWPNHPRHEISEMSPRQRTVLTLLLQGEQRKAIAENLDISIHTVGDHIKDVYRHFGVHSQAELIRRFVQGDGGDVVTDRPEDQIS